MTSGTPSAASEEPHNEPLIWTEDETDVDTEASTASGPDLHVESGVAAGDYHGPLPVWLRNSTKSTASRWIPSRLQHFFQKVAVWTKGPDPPYIYKIRPWFPAIQEGPSNLVNRYFPTAMRQLALLGCFWSCWLLTFSLVLHHSARAGDIQGYGKPENIWCGASFWSQNNDCGLNGNRCRPFDNATLAFRCPANCKATRVLNPRAIGDLEVSYKPFVIGGPHPKEENSTLPETVYRGDSFICQAAIHSGVIGNSQGGCGVARLAGEHSDFAATNRHHIQSFPFDSSFPKTFTFVQGLSSRCVRDLRWPLLAVTCGFTTILSILATNPAVLFFSTFVMLFFHVGLVSDPPNHADYPSLVSITVGRFLPAIFVATVIYRYSVKPQQKGLTANLERTVLWLGGMWVGALNNYTFDYIPIERLTPKDLHAQAGGILALIMVVLIIFFIALQQAWFLRQEGRFRKYISIYAAMVAGLLIAVAIPQLQLRIHHYFLAILLLPGTRTQTRPSLLYQGILIGLFINGTARWGFDSILQTALELRGADGQKGSLLPNITAPIASVTNITFNWNRPPAPYDGISVLVNDVERHKWYYGEGDPTHTFQRHVETEHEYFRFAFMRGSQTGDYTKSGIWETNGNWSLPRSGASWTDSFVKT